jgi:hypothetical protein
VAVAFSIHYAHKRLKCLSVYFRPAEAAGLYSMRFAGIVRRLLHGSWVFLALALFTLLPAAASGVEQAEEFVRGLQARGLNELALEYLEGLKTSPLANDAVKKQVLYLRGVALIEQSRRETDSAQRNRLLDEARKELIGYADINPNSVQGADAQLQLATVQMTQAQQIMDDSAKLPADKSYDAQRRKLGRDARSHLTDAREILQRAEETYSKELDRLPPPAGDEPREEAGTQRQKYRGKVAQLQYLAAQTQYDSARTYPPQADEFKKLHKTAAEELSTIYEEFGNANAVIALYAHLLEGRCYQALGESSMAMGCFEDILRAPNVDPFRKLIAAALERKAEGLVDQQKYDDAIQACNACLKDANKEEETQGEWLGVRYQLAVALAKKSEAASSGSPEQRRLRSEAREVYRLVARSPGEYQVAARAAVATKASDDADDSPRASKKSDAKNFQGAYDAGKEALAAYNAAKQAIPTAEKNNPSAVPDLKVQMDRAKDEARHHFQLAASMVESDTDLKQVNEVRYFLCWLYWEANDFYRAAVLGDFLARRYPDHPAAASAAKIAMAAFDRLHNLALAANDKGEFEARQTAQMAEFIVRRWPGSDDADAAFSVLVGSAIRTGKVEEAEKMLQQASKESQPRLELMLGNALWARYLEASQNSSASAPNADAIAKLETSAVKYLHSGFETAKKESPMSDAGATAALYLVQSQLNDGSYTEAIATLEDKTAGPLALIAKQHAAATRPQYAVEAYKAALRAYVSVSPPQEKKALAMMGSLEKLVGTEGDGKSTEQLNRIYMGLGVALQKQIEDLRGAGKQKDATRVSNSFAKLLDRIKPPEGDTSWPTRAWLAQMYYTVGSSDPSVRRSGSDPEHLSKQAKDYLTKSRDAYQGLLEAASKNPKFAPSEGAVLAAKLQLGEAYRSLGQYDKALDTFYEILQKKEMSLEVQRAAALAYQERGQNEDYKYFESAVRGGYKPKDGDHNLVWGWSKISQITAQAGRTRPEFMDTFYEARLNISKCRYLSAMKQKGDARNDELTKAMQSLRSFSLLYPDLGGTRWKPEFEQLRKVIESEQNPEKKDLSK